MINLKPLRQIKITSRCQPEKYSPHKKIFAA